MSMTFEERLASIDQTLKSLLTVFQTQAAAPVALGAPDTDATPAADKPATRRTKKNDTPADAAAPAATDVVDGDPAGTVYWVIEKHNTVYAQRPGEPAPAIEGAKIESAEFYLQKKEEFAKKINAAAEQSKPAQAEPSATATPAAAETNSASSDASPSISFQQVVAKLQELSKDTRPGRGRQGVLDILTKYGVQKVPALEALKKNAEIMADVEAALAEDAVEDVFA